MAGSATLGLRLLVRRLEGLGVVGLEEEAPSGGSFVPGAGAATLGEGGGCLGGLVFGVLKGGAASCVARALRGVGRTGSSAAALRAVSRLVRDDEGAVSGARGVGALDAGSATSQWSP